MAAFIGLQQDSLEFRSNASISAYPGQKKESVWTQKASACHIIYCAWQGRRVKEAFDLSHCHWGAQSHGQGLQIHPANIWAGQLI